MDYYDILFAKKLNDGGGGGGSSQTHTATITSPGLANRTYVEFNDVQYVTGTFTYEAGDHLRICASSGRNIAYLSIDNTVIISGQEEYDYDYVLPNYDINIQMDSETVRITFPTVSITQNGIADVENYIRADVNVPSEVIFRTLSITNSRSTGTAAQKRISVMIFSVDANQQVQCNSTNVNGGALKDITLPFVTTGQDFIVIRTASTSTEPVFASNDGVELIGHMVNSTVRYSIVKIPVGNPISLTVS